MKATGIELSNSRGETRWQSPDRLTRMLIWAAVLLAVAVIAMCVNLLLWPGDAEGPIAQAIGPVPPSRSPVPSPSYQPTLAPTEEIPLPTEVPTIVAEAAPAEEITPQACVPPDDWGIHIVQQGNTLRSIAHRYGTDIDSLMYVNCLNTRTIFVNQRIYVPGPVLSPANQTSMVQDPIAPASAPRPGASATPAVGSVAQPTTPPSPASGTSLRVDIPDHYLNILLLGSDKRPNSGAWRTDSMIIVSVDMVNNVVRMLSIPRDLWVNIPGHGFNRVNTADLWGELAKKGSGPDRVKQTIYQNLGIPIHYYVRVDFKGFINVIDTVGGVDIDVDCPLPDIKLDSGMHHMDGKQALRYARSRKSTNDFDRGRRQRKVLLALWDQALTMDIIPKLPELWLTMSGTFQTDLPLSQVINLAYVGVQLKPQHILSKAIGPSHVQSWTTPQGAAVLLPRQDRIQAMLTSFYAPIVADRLDVADKVQVRILNGGRVNNAEELASAALRRSGVKIVATGVADNRNYAQTQILVYSDSLDAAEKVADGLQVPSSAIQNLISSGQQPDPANPVDIQVMLGRDYSPCQR